MNLKTECDSLDRMRNKEREYYKITPESILDSYRTEYREFINRILGEMGIVRRTYNGNWTTPVPRSNE